MLVRPDLPHPHGSAVGRGVMRSRLEDFIVDEQLGFDPPGHGDHWFLRIEKSGSSTAWVARRLAELSGCHVRDVGYSGLKDRQAITTQWFSLPRAQRETLPAAIETATEFKLCQVSRNPKKLKRGTHRGNRFRLTFREVDAEPEALTERLALIATRGVPNYFGPQRFGRNGSNLRLAMRLFSGARLKRSDRSFALSSARSELFNRILAMRVRQSCWDSLVAGDHANLDGRGSVFPVAELTPELVTRCRSGEIHPAGTLWGAQGGLAAQDAGRIESAAADELPELTSGLQSSDVRSQHRALRLIPAELSHEILGRTVVIGFSLPAGSFATTVMSEVLDVVDASQEPGRPFSKT